MTIKKVNVLGMILDEWSHKSCIAQIGVGDDWATVYSIESKEKRKGHATHLLKVMKKHYELEGKEFGSTVALNDSMKRLLIKLQIPEYI